MVLKENFACFIREYSHIVTIKDKSLMYIIRIRIGQEKDGIKDDHAVVIDRWENALLVITLNVTRRLASILGDSIVITLVWILLPHTITWRTVIGGVGDVGAIERMRRPGDQSCILATSNGAGMRDRRHCDMIETSDKYLEL